MTDIDVLREDLAARLKKGVNFILAAAIVWLGIAYLWTLTFSSYDKSVFTFIVGSVLLPLAFALGKLLKIQWKVENNPLQPLGLWLNFAQLFYFPFLVFMLIRDADHFVMTYAIITGAHFFPFAWLYKELSYAIAAGVISVGAMFMGLWLNPEQMFLIPLAMGGVLLVLGIKLLASKNNISG